MPVIKIWDTIVILCFVSHFFASKWILIGYNQLLTNHDGWIYQNYLNEMQELNYKSYYISAIYWVITTFTSVGYGDIKGNTQIEFLFTIGIEMIGIAFYGYMIGVF